LKEKENAVHITEITDVISRCHQVWCVRVVYSVKGTLHPFALGFVSLETQSYL